MSWNILNDGNLFYNWRQSYGLYYPEELHKSKLSEISYDQHILFSKLEIKRLNNIIKKIKNYKPDILLLQEVSGDKKKYLGNFTVSEYLANKLLYTIINTSFKHANNDKNKLFKWNYPPFEREFGIKKYIKYLNSGVSTLVKNKRHFSTEYLCRSENFGYSSLFKYSYGSPMTINKIYIDNKYIILVNIHMVMNYPNTQSALQELISRLTNTYHALDIDSKEGFLNTIIMGDFNCTNKISFSDLQNSVVSSYLNDISENKTNNKILIGKSIKKYRVKNLDSIKFLKMNINDNKDGIRWKQWWENIETDDNQIKFTIKDKKYSSKISQNNNDLIFKKFDLASDQIPILLNIE